MRLGLGVRVGVGFGLVTYDVTSISQMETSANPCEKSQSTLCRKSWVFSGCSGFLPQGKLTGWVRINTVRKVIKIVVKINSLG